MASPYVMTPREIVSELDRYIVGQHDAKRAVAIALRNRWRRQNVAPELRDEIAPKNILMIGPTGVGKTEIARRLARLAQAPFVKVEASRYTEVGYVGRDVESMIRDLAEIAVKMVREEERARVAIQARDAAEERLLDILYPPPAKVRRAATVAPEAAAEGDSHGDTREKLRKLLRQGHLDDREVEVETSAQSTPMVEVLAPQGMEEMGANMREILGQFMPKKSKRQKVKVPQALELLAQEEAARLVDMEKVAHEAINRAEQSGIVFIDEIDKIAGRESAHGPDVSREGVQRDLLPIVEGSTVNTKYGAVRTDHILFVASGAFHTSKPSDLIPEFQGRFPIRVELQRAHPRGLHPHPDRARERADPPVRGADGDRERASDVHRRRGRGAGRDRGRGQRALGKYRRPPAPYGARTAARRAVVQRARADRTHGHGRQRLCSPAA